MSDEKRFTLTRDGHVATVELAGPGGKAVMDERFFAELAETFTALDADADVRAIVVTGAGPHFSFGLDLAGAAATFVPMRTATHAGARQELLALIRRWQAALDVVAGVRKPTVAAVTGWCIGGGVDLAVACDVRIASADAQFSVREAKVGIVADLGSLQRLVGVIGDGHLRELALTGDDIAADRAAAVGLVNHVHADAPAALAAAQDLAARMAANSPLVLRGVKDVLDAERGPRVEAGLRYTAVWNAAFLLSNDLDEAITSFVERRPPEFTGR
ncbi:MULTISPECIES: crotonase/enoyl-CoA hydratase family protein [unclassified Nocardioides]|uniref:crotonase/enoyl-CoA hydratase family protein n=1 Tax=unclassified Nocardioides TaxID=2615069 RepID=UPI0007031DC9|nr:MULTISPECIES: crotonase/enoyl-CoA hydratase family protein [unclassified Nocardioides]KRC54147.1 enoyl-CoA hydratase [Nocardioides sp. Root79]KRC71483.1 enoyl-CoA hydratase [Nocardioides sp. Root240]